MTLPVDSRYWADDDREAGGDGRHVGNIVPRRLGQTRERCIGTMELISWRHGGEGRWNEKMVLILVGGRMWTEP